MRTREMDDTIIAAFVADVRSRRTEAGKPDHIDDAAVYRLFDALLARDRRDERHAA